MGLWTVRISTSHFLYLFYRSEIITHFGIILYYNPFAIPGAVILIILFLSYLVDYWKQNHKSIHFLKGNDATNTPIVTDCCNNQEFLRKSQKKKLIYCLEKQNIVFYFTLALFGKSLTLQQRHKKSIITSQPGSVAQVL